MAAQDYLQPIDLSLLGVKVWNNVRIFSAETPEMLKDFSNVKPITILGIQTEHTSGSKNVANEIRSCLYSLSCHTALEINDIGNFLLTSENENDLIFLIQYLINKDTNLLILSEDLDLKRLVVTANNNINRKPVVSSIDSHLDVYMSSGEKSYFWQAIEKGQDASVNYYYHLASQEYFVELNEIEFFKEAGLENIGLGMLRTNLTEAEPLMRMTNYVNLNTRALELAELANSNLVMPNGLRGDEICQLSRYAGLADGLNCFSINHSATNSTRESYFYMLIAQISWYYIHGIAERRNEYPFEPIEKYQKYILFSSNIKQNLTFYNNPLSQRWWFEVPTKNGLQILPCTFDDYKKSSEGHIPDRWWKWVSL